MVVFGPVLDGTGSWGLGVVEADDEAELRAFAAGDPAVTSGTAEVEVGALLAGFVPPELTPTARRTCRFPGTCRCTACSGTGPGSGTRS